MDTLDADLGHSAEMDMLIMLLGHGATVTTWRDDRWYGYLIARVDIPGYGSVRNRIEEPHLRETPSEWRARVLLPLAQIGIRRRDAERGGYD